MEDHEDDWRRLALQFDRHRMQAIAHLKAMLKDPVKHAALAAEFVNSPPLDPTLAVPSKVKGMLSTTCPFCENGFSFELGPMCGCGAKLAKDCEEEWGPTCDLGNNPDHVKVVSLQAQPAEVSDDGILTAGHRLAWRYKHSTDPSHSSTYTFNRACLLQFARAILTLRPQAAQQAVPMTWTSTAERVPLEGDGEVFVRFKGGSIGTAWATYWHGASNDFAQWTHPDPDEDRTVEFWMKPPAITAQGAQGEQG